jgi:hypothetical protein
MLDKRAFLKDLRGIENGIIRDMNYNPEKDLAHLVLKHNLEWRIIMKSIKRELSF